MLRDVMLDPFELVLLLLIVWSLPFLSVFIVVDSQENQIYEDIVDHNSVTTNSKTSQHGPESSVATTVTNTDSGFSSARRRKLAAGSDDSWGSGEFESFSSDEEEDEVSRKVHSPTYEYIDR